MQFDTIDFLAVAIATVAAFAFGAVWYMALARPWVAATGRSQAEIKAAGRTFVPYVVSLVALFVMATVLAAVLGNVASVPPDSAEGVSPAVGLGDALKTAVLLWVGFVLTSMAVNHAYQGARRSLTVIDGGHWLGVLLVQAAVLSLV